jgi:hypothetical protein
VKGYYVYHWSGRLCVIDGVAIRRKIAEQLRNERISEMKHPIDYKITRALPFGYPIYFTKKAKQQIVNNNATP